MTRKNVPPITALTGRLASLPIFTFLCASDCVTITLTDAQRESAMNMKKPITYMDELH